MQPKTLILQAWIGNQFSNLWCINNHVLQQIMFFTKNWCFKFVARKLQAMATYYVGFRQMYGCGLAMNLITIYSNFR
jgi:hypothetical protein